MAAISVFADLQARLTHLGVPLIHGNMYHKAHIPVVAQEQVQHIAVTFGWVAQLWATETYSQAEVAAQAYHIMALAVGVAGVLADKYWSLSNKE